MKNLVNKKIFQIIIICAIIFGCIPSAYAQGGANTTASDEVWKDEPYFKTWMNNLHDSIDYLICQFLVPMKL